MRSRMPSIVVGPPHSLYLEMSMVRKHGWQVTWWITTSRQVCTEHTASIWGDLRREQACRLVTALGFLEANIQAALHKHGVWSEPDCLDIWEDAILEGHDMDMIWSIGSGHQY